MTTMLPWIPQGTWYMAGIVVAWGCAPDQFVSMGSDGGGSVPLARAAAGSAGMPSRIAATQDEQPNVATEDAPANPTVASGVASCPAASSNASGAGTGGEAAGVSGASADAGGTNEMVLRF
jgi:hypothetical protein